MNKEERCSRCCGYDHDSGECKAYMPWGLLMMEKDDCTFFDWHEERKARQCKACKHWVFTETIGSKDKPVWHCRHGFTPSKDCREMADYNDKCKAAYYRKHPEDLQLSFNF